MRAERAEAGRRGLPARRRQCLAALAGLTAALLAAPLGAGPAHAQPVYPSAGQVARAKAAVVARTGDVAAIEGRLAAADVALGRVQVDVDQAVEAYDAAMYRLQLATAAAVSAGRSADAAESAVDAARTELGRFAAASYRSGGGLASAEVVLGSATVDDLARGTAVLAILGGQRDAALRKVQAAKSVATVLRHSADAALAQQQAAAQAVAQAKAAAQSRLAGQQAQVDAIQAQRTQLITMLAAAKRTSVTLEAQRVAGLERERQARVAAAAAAAARRAAAAARARAASARGSHGGGSGGGGSSPAPVPAPGGSSHGTSSGAAAAIAYAQAQLGKPYVWGAAGPDAFDCSGLTMQAWARGGVSLPHSSVAQYADSQPVSLGDLRPGDLIFYATDPNDYQTIYHVGLYVGGGQMIEAPHTGDVVKYFGIYDQPNLFGAARP